MAKKITLPALILCGGKGLRLRPITKDNPKPLIKINNKPILYYIISHLQKQGIKDFIIATGYKSNKIEAFMRKDFKKLSYTFKMFDMLLSKILLFVLKNLTSSGTIKIFFFSGKISFS